MNQPSSKSDATESSNSSNPSQADWKADIHKPQRVSDSDLFRLPTGGVLDLKKASAIGQVNMQANYSNSLHIHQNDGFPSSQRIAAYETALPGAGDRILKMVEAEQAHRHQIEQSALHADIEIATKGQNIASGLAIITLICGTLLGALGHSWLGGVMITTTLAILLGTFILRKLPKSTDIEDENPADRGE